MIRPELGGGGVQMSDLDGVAFLPRASVHDTMSTVTNPPTFVSNAPFVVLQEGANVDGPMQFLHFPVLPDVHRITEVRGLC